MSGATLRLLPPELLSRLKTLELRSRRVVDGVLTGLHRSPLHGASVEFSEHAQYSPGDEIRHIDWRVFGRSDRAMVRRYEHETNLQVLVVLDVSSSMAYQSPAAPLSKWAFGARLAAALGYLVLRQQDAVGLLLTRDGGGRSAPSDTYLPPRARSSHLESLWELLEKHPPSERRATSLLGALSTLNERLGRRGLVFVVSDFFEDETRPDEPPAWFRVAAELERQGHHLGLLQVLDPWEVEFPFTDMTVFESLESGERSTLDPRLVRSSYLDALRSFTRGLRVHAARSGLDFRAFDTRSPVDAALAAFLTGNRASREAPEPFEGAP